MQCSEASVVRQQTAALVKRSSRHLILVDPPPSSAPLSSHKFPIFTMSNKWDGEHNRDLNETSNPPKIGLCFEHQCYEVAGNRVGKGP